MKKVAVIGGSYFLGRVFVEEALKAGGLEITVINRGHRPLNMPGVTEKVCDRNDAPALKAALAAKAWDCVVDFCAYHPNAVKSLFAALPPEGAGRYVFISTVSVYAPTRVLPVTENSPLLSAPLPLPGPAATYGYDKRLAEHAVIGQGILKKIPYTILRPVVVFGRYNYAPRERYFFDLVENGQAVTIPKGDMALFQFVYVADVARAIIQSLKSEKAADAVYNLAAPELISYGRLADVLEQAMERKIDTTVLPVSRIEAERIPLPFPLSEHWIHSGEKIVRDLQFSYTPLVAAMKETYRDYRNSLR